MVPIRDFSWMKHLTRGTVLEKFPFRGYRAVAIKVPDRSDRHNTFQYRLLFFQGQAHKPVLSLNLESSILGAWILTEHTGMEHLNLGHVEEGMSYSDFKHWALDQAEHDLDSIKS